MTSGVAAKKQVKSAATPEGKHGHLLIVESPAKAKTIKKFLGCGFTVKASLGHVRDIPNRVKGKGRARFGIDFENGYQPVYTPIPERQKVLKDLAESAAKVGLVYLATDPDREGEAIAWHIKEALSLPDEKVRRVTFNAITRRAVQDAMQKPTAINMNLVNAQQGRRVLDRIFGYSLSEFLWKKITKGLSAGRVQSVAVRMIVDRERQIRAFKPEEFWRIRADLSATADEQRRFTAILVEWQGRKFGLGEPAASNAEQAQSVAAILRQAAFQVTAVNEKEVKGRPKPPFITSTLQQAASTFLRFSAVKTMRIAQELYEGVELAGGVRTGLITYMRTDSTRIAPEALDEARAYIRKAYGEQYVPEKPQIYASRRGAQDAHEAIRPVSVEMTPESLRSFLSDDQFMLYDLIWRRFLASQMTPSVCLITIVDIAAAAGRLEAKGRRMLFEGHTILGLEGRQRTKGKVETTAEDTAAEESMALAEEIKEEKAAAGEEIEEDEQPLPPLQAGDVLRLHDLAVTQHFTQPPPRYSEASLVRALEKEGIGRPSTYAPIVQTIQERGYVKLINRRFHATELGIAATDILLQNFAAIMDLKFTASMEADLDHVEEGKVDWRELVDRFYKPFADRLEKALQQAEPLKGRPAPNNERCPQCGAEMVIRYSQNGAFLGCARYPECQGTIHLPAETTDDEAARDAPACPACGAAMILRRSRFGVFWGCSKYPECRQTLHAGRDGKPVIPPEIKRDCEICGSAMRVQAGRRGFRLVCSDEKCNNIKGIDRHGQVVDLPRFEGINCEKCGAAMITRLSRRGPFLSCSAFPKCRNAKPLPKEAAKGSSAGANVNPKGEG